MNILHIGTKTGKGFLDGPLTESLPLPVFVYAIKPCSGFVLCNHHAYPTLVILGKKWGYKYGIPSKYCLPFLKTLFTHPNMGNKCSFSHRFTSITSPDEMNWPSDAVNLPGPGSSESQLFLLPAYDITERSCTPSPFLNGTPFTDESATIRSPFASWAQDIAPVPSQCGDDLTKSIVSSIGPGTYGAPPPEGSSATLFMASDEDTIACGFSWGPTAPAGIQVASIVLSVSDGPIFSQDDILSSGNKDSPAWQSTNIDLWSLNQAIPPAFPPFVPPTFSYLNNPNVPEGFCNFTSAIPGGIAEYTCTQDVPSDDGGDSYSSVGTCYSSCCSTGSTIFQSGVSGNELVCVLSTFYDDDLGMYIPSSTSSCTSASGGPCPLPLDDAITSAYYGTYEYNCLACSLQEIPHLDDVTLITCVCPNEEDGGYTESSCSSISGCSLTSEGQIAIATSSDGTLACEGSFASSCTLFPELTPPNTKGYGVSLSEALPLKYARNYTRLVTCLVEATDPLTGLPMTLSAEPQVVLEYGQPWVPYQFPQPGNYVPSCPDPSGTCAPTPAPTIYTDHPSRRPTAPSFAPSKVM